MKKSLKTFMLACAATTAVTLALATSAFAKTGNDITADIDFDKAAGTVSMKASAFEGLSGQTTILIHEQKADGSVELTADDILYINQDEAGTTTFTGMGMKGGLVEGKTYVVKIGGENLADGILEGTFTIENGTVKYILGDVTGEGDIDMSDSNAVVMHFIGAITIEEGTPRLAADVTGEGDIDMSDSNAIVMHFIGAVPIQQPGN